MLSDPKPIEAPRASGKTCSQSPLRTSSAAMCMIGWSVPRFRLIGSVLPFRKNCLRDGGTDSKKLRLTYVCTGLPVVWTSLLLQRCCLPDGPI